MTYICIYFSNGASQVDKAAYSVEEFLATTSIGRSRFYAAVKAGKIKVHKFGNRTIILAEDLKAFLQSLPEGRAA